MSILIPQHLTIFNILFFKWYFHNTILYILTSSTIIWEKELYKEK